ncbi:MAG: hypothetical protein GY862_11700 [Gammaproteobacteria bacterium]|nr:hypothetical protein [Gammaproteobacteria bacterium]
MIKKIKKLIKAIKDFILLPVLLWSLVRRFIEEGAVVIKTGFSYRTADKSYDGHFETSVYLDGNIINRMPNPALLPDDAGWQAQLEQYGAEHFQKINDMTGHLGNIHKMGQRAAELTGTAAGLVSAAFADVQDTALDFLTPLLNSLAEIHPLLVNVFWFFAASVAGGLMFSYLLQPLLLALIVRRVKRLLGK